MPGHWIGPLISADGLAALVVHILVTPLLHAGNARRTLYLGAALSIAALASYQWALTPVTILAVRLLSGCGFAILVAALMALLPGIIPVSRSGFAFGIISTIRLVPYAVVPPLLGLLALGARDFADVVLYAALFMVVLLPMIRLIRPLPTPGIAGRRPNPALRLLGSNLLERPIAVLLLVTLLLSSSFVTVFFYIGLYATMNGVRNPGLFFTIATVLMIATRLFGAPLMDRLNKRRVVAGSQFLLVVAFLLLVFCRGEGMFFTVAALAGLGWGVSMPLISALLFAQSRPEFRGINSNAGMIMYQGGFFIGPFLGGLLQAEVGYAGLFAMCAVASLLIMVLVQLLPAGEPQLSR